jgi:parallel beta-helix repeat protein
MPFPSTRAATLLALCALGAMSHAATYYVAPSGSDTNNGSTAKPWKTLGRANQLVSPGDTVIVRAGTYTGDITLSRGGTASRYVTYASETIGGAKIRGTGYSAIQVSANYIRIIGFDIVAKDGHGIDAQDVHHVVFSKNIAHDCGGSGISANRTDYVTIDGNTTFQNSATNGYQCSGISIYQARAISDAKPGFHNVVSGNVSYDNIAKFPGEHTDGNGIIIDDFHNGQGDGPHVNYPYATLVENNICYRNGSKGIQVYVSDNVTVRNNTVYWNNRDNQNTGTWRGELNNQEGRNNVWANNIAVTNLAFNANNTAILCGGGDGFDDSSTVFVGNLTYSGTPGDSSVKLEGTRAKVQVSDGNLLGQNPRFLRVPRARDDFQLQKGSPAIDHGINQASYFAPTDILTKRRPIGRKVDIGAFEQ